MHMAIDKEIQRLNESGLFDADWYAGRYPDVRDSRLEPEEHFLRYGLKLGRDPGPGFDSRYYLAVYPDVAKSNLPPLLHYLKHGIKEGRNTSALHVLSCVNVVGDQSAIVKNEEPPHVKIVDDKKSKVSLKPIRGDFNLKAGGATELCGWLALVGCDEPRTATIVIEGKKFSVVANVQREDLAKNGINKGRHGFIFMVPAEFVDGITRHVELVDSETGKILKKVQHSWSHNRKFDNFDEFLAESMLNPVIYAPFREADKRCFAMMENVRRYYSRKCDELKINIMVSVVMPAYNREDTIETAISSVLSQTYPHFELVVVDDGSTDKTAEKVATFGDPRIRLLSGHGNEGVSPARNRGIKAAKGEVIAYLDSDNTWEPEYLSVMLAVLDEKVNADAAYCGQYLYRGDTPKPFAVRFGSFNKSLLENRNYIDLNCLLHKKKVLEKTGIFDSTLKRFVDWDLILKISSFGGIVSVPAILSNYFYDKAENAITADATLLSFIDEVRVSHNTREYQKGNALLRYGQDPLSVKSDEIPKLSRGVSIVIPNYESLEDIIDCLSSIREHYDESKVEIIVVDNASSNEVRSFLAGEGVKHYKIRYISLEFNAGFTYAVNRGIEIARKGNDIVLLNNDALVTRNAISALQLTAYSNDSVGMVVPRQVLFANTKTINTHVPYANSTIDCDVNLSYHHNNIVIVPFIHDGSEIEINFAPFFCVYIRSKYLIKIEKLDEEYGRHYRSDRIACDYFRHILNKKIFYTPNAVVYHKLQKATDGMRLNNEIKKEFNLMFKFNQWDNHLLQSLGYKKAKWEDQFDYVS